MSNGANSNYSGLSVYNWPGTWVPTAATPIILDTEIRGGVRTISGQSGDRLADVAGQRLQDGMLVWLQAGYSANGYTFTSNTFYQYLSGGAARNGTTGNLPNGESYWTLFSSGGGGGSQGIQGTQGAQGIQGIAGSGGSSGSQGTQGSQGVQGTQGVQGFYGTQGTQGTQGIQGVQGTQGVQGVQGAGVQGVQGTQGAGYALTVQEVYDSNNTTANTVTNIKTLQFDLDSAFNVIDETNGIARIVTSSTFKYWDINGTRVFQAEGLDTLNLIANNNVTITGNANSDPKSLTFDLNPTINVSNVITQNINVSNNLITGVSLRTTNTVVTTSDSSIVIDSFTSSSYATVKYIIQAMSTVGVHSTEFFAMQDGVQVYTTEYATLFSVAALGAYSMNISSGNLNLTFTPYNPDNNMITIRLVRDLIIT